MKWSSGNCSSMPEDGSCYLEKDPQGLWHIYATDAEGRLKEGFPKLREEPFGSLEDAQTWAESRPVNQPA